MKKTVPVIAIIDNSVAFTGAFRCALAEVSLLKSHFDFFFVIPENSQVTGYLEEASIRYYAVPFLEISRSTSSISRYVPRLFRNASRVKSVLVQEQADIVQVNDFYNLTGALARILGYKGKIVTCVRFLPAAVPKPLRYVWIKFAYMFSDAVIAVSKAVYRQLPPHRKTVCIYDSVSFHEKEIAKPDRDPAVVFLYLGNFIRGKGQNHALEAFRTAAAVHPGIKLRLVGGDMGLAKNKAFRRELELFVSEHRLANVVSFEPFQNNIERLMKSADVLLNFSEAESFSMTCAEASFFGLPVIATRCGGPEEIVENEKTGLLVENRNTEQMSSAILELAASPEKRQQMGKKGKEYVQKKFSGEAYFAAITGLFQKLLSDQDEKT